MLFLQFLTGDFIDRRRFNHFFSCIRDHENEGQQQA